MTTRVGRYSPSPTRSTRRVFTTALAKVMISAVVTKTRSWHLLTQFSAPVTPLLSLSIGKKTWKWALKCSWRLCASYTRCSPARQTSSVWNENIAKPRKKTKRRVNRNVQLEQLHPQNTFVAFHFTRARQEKHLLAHSAEEVPSAGGVIDHLRLMYELKIIWGANTCEITAGRTRR